MKFFKTKILPFLLILMIAFLGSFDPKPAPQLDKAEAKAAFEFLNKVRMNPENYYKELNLNGYLPYTKTLLVWNDTLAAVAEHKALDMATRNYFGHVDPEGHGMNYFISKAGYKLEKEWVKRGSENYFESIDAGANDGIDAIKTLIIDQGVPSFGHRKHLLGLDKWNAALNDIGIGFATNRGETEYGTYVSVIIARHNW